MSALQAARDRLETYVAEVVLRTEIFNPAKLRFLEDEIERAVHHLEVTAPF